MNFEKLVWDILSAPVRLQQHDPEACLECRYHPANVKLEAGQHCYMFKEEPTNLCLQFRKV